MIAFLSNSQFKWSFILDFGLRLHYCRELIQQDIPVAARQFQPVTAGFGFDEILPHTCYTADKLQDIRGWNPLQTGRPSNIGIFPGQPQGQPFRHIRLQCIPVYLRTFLASHGKPFGGPGDGAD